MDVDHTAFTQAQWERNCQLSAAIIVGYEFITQFPKEVDFFWRRRWTFAKCLFLWSRYYSFLFSIGNAAGETFFRIQNPGAVIQYLTPQVILSLRLYAIEFAGMVVLLVLPKAGVVGTNNPSPGIFICADADPPHDHWIAYVPVLTLITESCFLGLAVAKAWQQYRSGMESGRLLPQLTKESVFFFVAIVGVHLANLIIWLFNTITVNEMFTGYTFAIPTVLANRLLISVREQVGHMPGPMSITSENPMTFRQPHPIKPRHGDMLELETIGNGRQEFGY
ncbi:hypothetical protein DFH09DRAFT_458962 [Mycena vulgaris]|nr:hypothetical protein DFH09DRAFT_458962 [Mycena vulgaris]